MRSMVSYIKYCNRIEYKLLRTELTHIHSLQSGICMIELSLESDSSIAKHSATILWYLMILRIFDLIDTLISNYIIKTLIWLS